MKANHNDVYTLHIDAHHHDAHVQKLMHKKEHIRDTKHKKSTYLRHAPNVETPRPAPITHHPSLLTAIWNKIEFPVVTAVVFVVLYSILNWQALAANVTYYWGIWQGRGSELEHLVVQDQSPVPERLMPLEGGVKNELPIPPLKIEVMPSDTRLVLPRINQNVPVVGVRNDNLIARQWEQLEKDIQASLQKGVIHYPGTALPGEGGNVVLTGHSSYYAWDPGRFKDVFALLHQVQTGDKVLLYFNQKKYIYEIEKRVVVLPEEVDVLASSNREQLTLITCTPIGTNLKRLVLTAKFVGVE